MEVTQTLVYTALYVEDGDGWSAWVEELPGANAQGDNLAEARRNLRTAVMELLEANQQLSQELVADRRVIREPLAV